MCGYFRHFLQAFRALNLDQTRAALRLNGNFKMFHVKSFNHIFLIFVSYLLIYFSQSEPGCLF
ncbi:MAG: hypothetical protein BGO39_03525 [Chloroflexi bacterium 54-19]|nr:MAG: hypothetical protein BGO39_03525 [Chloroflexi bacterium 54-19]